MTLAQLAALIDAETPEERGPDRGTGADLVAFARLAEK